MKISGNIVIMMDEVELKTAEEMSQKVTTSDTKQYTYDGIRLAYGDIGSLKDKDGNEIAAGAAENSLIITQITQAQQRPVI